MLCTVLTTFCESIIISKLKASFEINDKFPKDERSWGRRENREIMPREVPHIFNDGIKSEVRINIITLLCFYLSNVRTVIHQ